MSAAQLAIVLAGALVALAVVLNHTHARLALVELALNEGLPPGHGPLSLTASTLTATAQIETLEPGVHVFLSRGCHACQRLISELAETDVAIDAAVFLHYADHPRPIAAQAADRLGATLREYESQLVGTVAADPLPYTIAVGSHELVSRSVTPSVALVLNAARDAGISGTQR